MQISFELLINSSAKYFTSSAEIGSSLWEASA